MRMRKKLGGKTKKQWENLMEYRNGKLYHKRGKESRLNGKEVAPNSLGVRGGDGLVQKHYVIYLLLWGEVPADSRTFIIHRDDDIFNNAKRNLKLITNKEYKRKVKTKTYKRSGRRCGKRGNFLRQEKWKVYRKWHKNTVFGRWGYVPTWKQSKKAWNTHRKVWETAAP